MLETSKRKKTTFFFRSSHIRMNLIIWINFQSHLSGLNKCHSSIFGLSFWLFKVHTYTSCVKPVTFLFIFKNCIAACSIQTLFKYFTWFFSLTISMATFWALTKNIERKSTRLVFIEYFWKILVELHCTLHYTLHCTLH